MRAALVVLAVGCVVLGVVPGLLLARLAGLAPWPSRLTTSVGLHVPGTGTLPAAGFAVVLVVVTSLLVLARGSRVAAPTPVWMSGQQSSPQLRWTTAGFTKPLRLVLEVVLRPEREIVVETAGGVVQEASYSGRVPHLLDERVYRPAVDAVLVTARHARRLQTGRLGTYVAYLIALVVALLAAARAGILG
jgi:hydrogenase-4 component B